MIDDYENRLRQATELQESGQFGDAQRIYRELMQQKPQDPRLWFYLGTLALQQGQSREACELLTGALRIHPEMTLARQNLAASLHSEGRHEEAERHYRQVLEAEPDNHQVLENLGTLYKQRGQLPNALCAYGKAMQLRRRIPQGDIEQLRAIDAQADMTSLHSLRLEAEQLEHLLESGLLQRSFEGVLEDYRQVIAELEGPRPSHRLQLDVRQFGRIGRYIHRLIHLHSDGPPRGPILNPALDNAEITRRYQQNAPSIVVVDNFLTASALEALRTYCFESTIWFDYTKAGGYSGAYMQKGFGNELLLTLAAELRETFPEILGSHPLNQMWAYIYDSQQSGITAHADQAAVNLNFWLTPDEANLDAGSGGLVVCTREAPAEWDFDQFNNRPEEIEAFARGSEARVIPHRCNRLVMFHSNLIHRTDDFKFKPGLLNRRINVTMLFGERETVRV